MKNFDLSNEFCKSMQNLEILLYEGNIEENEIIDLIGKYSYATNFYKSLNMNVEYKYYLEKINNLLEDKNINDLLSEYLNTFDNIENSFNLDSGCDQNRKNILKFISTNSDTIFSKNYIEKIINRFLYFESQKENIITKDLDNQQKMFRERLKNKSGKETKSIKKLKISNMKEKYLSENSKHWNKSSSKIEEKFIKYVSSNLFDKILSNKIDSVLENICDRKYEKLTHFISNFENNLEKILDQKLNEKLKPQLQIYKDTNENLFIEQKYQDSIENIKRLNIFNYMETNDHLETSQFKNKNLALTLKNNLDDIIRNNNKDIFKKNYINKLSSNGNRIIIDK